ncbi:hypothetical protein RJ639_037834 [Escallonia herrerae]|uniref:Nucleolar 27S pre-rRNA processing Urb2/Npa2 C-terminal domain-containing protein n=1 Tax=Escallonia herrerae TaxID=1293975 RepID=A0AA88WLW1_9ASTE|nr:hypothetical protein RJ639_037834 [Escallonia herrerae]
MAHRRSTASSILEVFSLDPLPYPVILFLCVIFIFLGTQWYVSYESMVEAAEENMGWALLAAPLLIYSSRLRKLGKLSSVGIGSSVNSESLKINDARDSGKLPEAGYDVEAIANGYFTGYNILNCFILEFSSRIRQQKDVLGQHSFQFLSSYIWIYSGYGPLKSGIRREIDEALRPGVYALIDACSPDDLQHIHTVFGEGPCRSTLAALQQDYKQNFQYEGKL